jgi:hypothetical protein
MAGFEGDMLSGVGGRNLAWSLTDGHPNIHGRPAAIA